MVPPKGTQRTTSRGPNRARRRQVIRRVHRARAPHGSARGGTRRQDPRAGAGRQAPQGPRVTQDREGIVAVQRRRRFIFRRRRRREQRVERRGVPWRRPALLRRGTHRGTAPAPSRAARVG